MKSGVYDGESHKTMDQAFTREDTLHAWYDEPGGLHPFDRTTKPTQKNTLDTAGKYSWATAVRHAENGRLEAGPLARQMVAGGKHGEHGFGVQSSVFVVQSVPSQPASHCAQTRFAPSAWSHVTAPTQLPWSHAVSQLAP